MADRSTRWRSVWVGAWLVLVLARTVAGAPPERPEASGDRIGAPSGQAAEWEGKPGAAPDETQGPEDEVDSPGPAGGQAPDEDTDEGEHPGSGPESTPPEGVPGEAPDRKQGSDDKEKQEQEQDRGPVEAPGTPGEKDRDKSGKDGHRDPPPGTPERGNGRDEKPPPASTPAVSRGGARGNPRSRAGTPRSRVVLLLDDGAGVRTVHLGDADPGTVVEFRVRGRVVSDVYWRLAYTASAFSSSTGTTFPISYLAYGGTDLDGLTPLRPAGDIYPLRPPTGEAGYAFEHVFVLTFPEDAEPGEYRTEIRYDALPVDQTRPGKDGEKDSKGKNEKTKTPKSGGKGGSSG